MSDLPDDVVDRAERLTRLARRAVDDNEAAACREERDALLAEHGFTARVRQEETRAVLVCYPTEWVDDGTVHPDDVEDLSRAAERPLDGPGDEDRYAEIDAHNRAVVDAVAERGGEIHARNAAAFADFMGNHYVRRVETATAGEVREFLEEYFPRNAWPTDEQHAAVESSLRLVFEVEDRRPPAPLRD